MIGESSIFSEIACDKVDDKIVLDPNDIEGQLEFVKKFIHEHGRVYDYDIRKALEEFDVDMDSIKALVNKRRNMYERLSKLWLHFLHYLS